MFSADAELFLLDGGKQVTFSPAVGSPISGLMLFDEESEPLDGNQVISRQYRVTFATASWPGLKRESRLLIDGITYRLRTDPLPGADGVFSSVALSKV